MEEYNLKEFWQEIHTETEVKPVYVREVIRKKHCNVISQTIHRQKILICLYTCFLAMSVATSIWDMCIIGSASLSLWTASAFLLFLLLSSIGHYQLLIRSADLYSIKDSGVMLRKRLRRRINIDFSIYLIFFYGTASRFIIQYFKDFEGLKELSFVLILFVCILLTIPWLMRYQQKHRYRYYLNSLAKSQNQLEVSE
ncbi:MULTISPECIES: hypothetical protein [Bacteroides]|jgi:hypothetical protein|uniref:hypothetical protein n=1 Tax=Bacteroides TaxID=816 RepID=UPI000E4A5088|nr:MULTISPECIES: hypothetical protein [Bacteroides]QNL39109.1 hypothetical protein H8796_00265 [Bacteroides sp. M10]RGR02426.1 hypothetical protein DWY71_04875 [Bacteroides sp. AF26-7BH]RGY34041.1 hypothetical protein DXA46_09595 [Bacteroides sp. OF02-3LB]